MMEKCKGCNGGRCAGCIYDPDPSIVDRREYEYLGKLGPKEGHPWAAGGRNG